MEEVVDVLAAKRDAAKQYLNTRYVLHPEYKLIPHHSCQHKQSFTLMNYLVSRGAIEAGRV